MRLGTCPATQLWRLSRTPQIRRTRTPCAAPSRPTAAVMPRAATFDTLDITRTNFRQALPLIKEALQECSFYAFDLEMTGLQLDHHRDEYLDDPQDRWNRMRESAGSYAISQFGLSCFKRMPDDSYLATTFNAYIFPEPQPAEVVGNIPPRKFMSDASSLAFLSQHGFNFNKWIAEGVPYMPARIHDEKLQQFAKAQAADTVRTEVTLVKPEDKEKANRLIDEVVEWLKGEEPERELAWLNNSFLRLVAYQELARPRAWQDNGALLTSEEEDTDPGFYVTKTQVDNWPRLKLVRGNRAAAAAAEAAARAARQALLQDAGGFADVMRAMRDSGKPAVGHNPFYDVAYVLASFAHGVNLPSQFSDFKKLVEAWFPGGLYDTKHLARCLPAHAADTLLPDGTALGSVYQALTSEGPSRAAAREMLAATGRSLPAVVHAPGSAKYSGIPAGGAAHEAGYDAMMTGTAFACLERLMAEAKPGEEEDNVSSNSFAHLASFKGRINVSRSDMPYLALTGPDAPLVRPYVLHVHPGGAVNGLLSSVLAAAGLPGRARITTCPPGVGGYLVEMEVGQTEGWDAARLNAALSEHQPALPWVVSTWEQYAAAKSQLLIDRLAAETPQGATSHKRKRVETTAPTAAPEQKQAPPAAAPPVPPRCSIS